MDTIRDTSSGKMSRAPFQAAEVRISEQFSRKSALSREKKIIFLDRRHGRGPDASWEMVPQLPGGSSTPVAGEYPSAADASILSEILEDAVPEKYYLSPKACQGILRRASARGRELPEALRTALERQALTA